MKTLTVRELYDRLHEAIANGIDESMEVIVRVQDEDANTMVGGLFAVAVDRGCTDVYAMMLDGATDAESAAEQCGQCGEVIVGAHGACPGVPGGFGDGG